MLFIPVIGKQYFQQPLLQCSG